METGVPGVVDTGSDVKEGLAERIEDVQPAEGGATVTIAQPDGTAKETYIPTKSRGGVGVEDVGNVLAELLPEELSAWLKAFLEAYTFGKGLTSSFANYFNMSGTESAEDAPDGPFEDRASDGKLLAKGCRKNGKLDGAYTTFYPDGKPMVESHYKNGKLHGDYTRFYANGNPKEVGAYKNGFKHGKFYTYAEDGKITGLTEYNYGRKVPVTLSQASTRGGRFKKKLKDFVYRHVSLETVEKWGALQTWWEKINDPEYRDIQKTIKAQKKLNKDDPDMCKAIEEKFMAGWKEKHPEKDYSAAWEKVNDLTPYKRINKLARADKKRNAKRRKLYKQIRKL